MIFSAIPPKSWLGNMPCTLDANYFCSQGFTAQQGVQQAAALIPARGQTPPCAPQPSRHPSSPRTCRTRAGSRYVTLARLCRCLPELGSISTSWHAERCIVPKIGLPHCIVTQACSGSKSNSLGFLGVISPRLLDTPRPQSTKQPWKRVALRGCPRLLACPRR